MRQYYVQIQCFYEDAVGRKVPFIETGLAEDYGEYVVYRDHRQGYIETFKSMEVFKKDLVYHPDTFDKYVHLTEFK